MKALVTLIFFTALVIAQGEDDDYYTGGNYFI